MDFSTLSNKDLQEIEKQLNCPEGKNGVEMGLKMNETNISMTLAALECIDTENACNILELGHGNAHHLQFLLEKIPTANYFGLEISETMHTEAVKMNTDLMENYNIDFRLYNGFDIPFDTESMDCIYTVNTLYFWQNPKSFCNKLANVLTKSGKLIIAFTSKETMEELPFVQDKFTKYSEQEFRDLIEQTNLNIIDFKSINENITSKTGEPIERIFHIVSLRKNELV